jgi:hypothetical protein
LRVQSYTTNLLPLCSRHHQAVHEGGWQLTMDPTSRVLTVRFPDGTVTTMPPPRKNWNGKHAAPVDAEPEPPPDLTLRAS